MIPPSGAATGPCGELVKLWIILSYQRLTAVAQNIDSGIPSQYGPRGLAGRFPDSGERGMA
jgi:hypothetical protein